MRRAISVGLLLFWFLAPGISVQAADTQLRSGLSLKTLDTGLVSLTTYGELHISDSTPNPLLYRISERVQLDPWERLSFGLGYTYIQRETFGQPDGHEVFKYQHRVEFEINPHWRLRDWAVLNLRNRLEYRWIEDRGSNNTRFRGRIESVFPVRWKPLLDVFTSVETFYDFRLNQSSENRFIPLGLDFRVSKYATLRTSYMVDWIHASHDWIPSHVFYVQWFFGFK